ncbi:hypothetical protein HZH68_009268 [Vespula germanica]|uniref:Uncharacterized protein n=1 Tax=Vespula germanica TaxID=30212 RepID=A0A834JV22_VESGE|nr:hypothetical protein HZH68_009268 [Vespula germanica]
MKKIDKHLDHFLQAFASFSHNRGLLLHSQDTTMITNRKTSREDCKDRLMDVFTKVCGNDRLKRGIEKFHSEKMGYKKFQLAKSIDFSLEREKKSISFNKHKKRDISAKIANPEGEHVVDVISGSNREDFYNQQRYYRQKSLPPASVRFQNVATDDDDLGFEMAVEELYELYNDFNDRLPRSFTQIERKKMLRDVAKTCCYEDNTCDSENFDGLCF